MGRPSTKATVVPTQQTKKVVEDDEIVVKSIAETVEQNLVEAKADRAKAKATVNTYTDDDLILVSSYRAGTVRYKNENAPYDLHVFESFGEVQEIRFGALKDLRRNSGEEPFTSVLFILDEEAVNQLGLKRAYAEMPEPTALAKIFDRPLKDVIKFLENCSETTKQVLREVLSNKLERKEPIDFYNLKAIAEKLDFELSLTL